MSTEEEPPRRGLEKKLNGFEKEFLGLDTSDRELYMKAERIVSLNGDAHLGVKIKEDFLQDFLERCTLIEKCMARDLTTFYHLPSNDAVRKIIQNFEEVYRVFYALKYPDRVIRY